MTPLTGPATALAHHLDQFKLYDGLTTQYHVPCGTVNYLRELFAARTRHYASTKRFDPLADLQGGLGEIAWGLYLCNG